MKKKINNKGFTLIELLAIIAITAIILGVGTYGIVNLVNKSKENSSLISETSIKGSASLYADEAGDSLWIDPGSGDYKYYCVTIDELINKGLIKKNAKLPKGIDKYNYVSIKKNKVTFVKGESLIIKDALDGSADASVCVGNIIKEKIEKAPKEKSVTSYTDEIDSVFDDLVGESKIIDKTCYFNKDSSSIVRDDGHKGIFDKSSNTCLIKGLDDETIYYYKTCMTTEKGSIICSDSYSTSTASFVSPEFSTKDDTITIKYKDDNVKEPYHYFKSNVNGNSDKNVSECVLGSDNKFTCSGSTSNITKDKWYKVNENEVKITYKDNEIKNGDITARIMDGTGNYKDNDKKFNLYRTVFKKGNADKINNSTNDITNICLNDIDKKCNIKSPSISKDGYTIVGWNTDSSASSIWKANTSKDIDGSNTYYPIIKSRVNIKLNANGGSVTKETSKGGTYTTDSSGIISRNGKNIFHTINYGEKMNSSGLANYNNSDYLYITKDGYFAYASETWICDSSSGCSTVGRTFDQDTAYKASDFCDASNGDCTVTLKVNWKAINKTINDWRCHDKYSYFITYCEPNHMCEYTAVAYKENGESYFKHAVGKIDSTTLNVSSCFLDSINDYRCNSNGKYYITKCSETTCNYTEFNGSSASGTVDRDTLRNCATQEHTHVWKARGIRKYAIGQSTRFTCGSYHNYGFAVYCSICGMSKDYYNSYVAKVGEKFVCPDYPYGTPSGWKIYDDCAITTRSSLQNISGGNNSFDETTKNSC